MRLRDHAYPIPATIVGTHTNNTRHHAGHTTENDPGFRTSASIVARGGLQVVDTHDATHFRS